MRDSEREAVPTCEMADAAAASNQAERTGMLEAQLARGMAGLFKALSDPTRLRIISALAGRELCVGDLACALEVEQSAVSHQLRLLRTLRLVRSRRDGRMILYALDDQHIVTLLQQGLRHVEEAEAGAARGEVG